MESEAIALSAIKCLREKPALWGHIQDNSGRMDPCCTNAVWDELMELPHYKSDELSDWRTRPSILIATFKGSRVSIHAVWFCATILQEVLTGPDSIVFLLDDAQGTSVLKPSERVCIKEGNIIVDAGPFFYQFDGEDPSWPWPLLYPERFTGLTQLGQILRKKDDLNPLTGLCRASDGAYRSLAKMVADKIESAYDQIARDIVASL
jgi:hypothetical protein